MTRAALRALDREDRTITAIMRAKVQEAFEDPRPDIPAEEVFEHFGRKHAARVKTGGRDA